MKTEDSLLKVGFQAPTSNNGDSNREVILRYLEAGGVGFELTKKQQELLDRWTWCDEKMRENVGRLKREEIAKLMMQRFNIARCTAFQDIVNTEYVFSTSTPLSKKYRMQLRIEFLEKEIRLASLDNDRTAVAMLEKVLQKYYLEYPDVVPTQSPTTWIFNVDARTINENPVSIEEAEAYIDKAENEFEELEIFNEEEEQDNEQ